jgi:hypothetical protein
VSTHAAPQGAREQIRGGSHRDRQQSAPDLRALTDDEIDAVCGGMINIANLVRVGEADGRAQLFAPTIP